MRFKRRRTDRPDLARRRLGADLERLEGRELLSTATGSLYVFSELPPRYIDHTQPNTAVVHPVGNAGPRQLSFLDNDGKVITGKDRQGDEYYLTLHGPGTMIVTDATPNDGSLDDDIDTIQLVGTDPHRTYVTGTVISSARTPSSGNFFATQQSIFGLDRTASDDGIGEVFFNRLISENGVRSIVLNGFTLTRTVNPPLGVPNNANTGIFLEQGVGLLEFHDIRAPIDLSTGDTAINIEIGDGSSPLIQQPIIRLDSIFNTVFDSTSTTIPTGPQTVPTVNIIVNGEIRGLEILSSTAEPVDPSLQYLFPQVGTTGRTAIRAQAIENLKVTGSARNVTASRAAIPFQNGFSGLRRLGRAEFGGNADALGLDVSRGRIGRLNFRRGLGNPVGTSRSATSYGTPTYQTGYPAQGLYGGLVAAESIGSIQAGPADLALQTAQDPDYIQELRTNSTRYYSRPGRALTSAAITSATDIGSTHIVGSLQTSEINAGFDYPSYAAGLEPVRAPSRIRPIGVRGDLLDSNVVSTVRPVDAIYGNGNDQQGRGQLAGHSNSQLIRTNARDALGNQGAGYFARLKSRRLPPPALQTRVQSVNQL